MSTTFRLSKGDFRATVLANAISFISGLPDSRVWRIEVREDRNSRSTQQCRYLNGVAFALLSEATGYERDDIAEYINGTYFGWRDKILPGKREAKVPVRTTTTDENGKRSVLDKMAFGDYVAFVQRFAAKHGVFIPDPE